MNQAFFLPAQLGIREEVDPVPAESNHMNHFMGHYIESERPKIVAHCAQQRVEYDRILERYAEDLPTVGFRFTLSRRNVLEYLSEYVIRVEFRIDLRASEDRVRTFPPIGRGHTEVVSGQIFRKKTGSSYGLQIR